jgi:hypothetical protein
MKTLTTFFLLNCTLVGCNYYETAEQAQATESADAGETAMSDDRKDASRMHKRQDWSQSGQLAVNDTARVVGLQGTFDPNEGAVHTVQFNVAPPIPPVYPPVAPEVGDGSFVAYADIQWTVNGGTNYRTVSVVDGMSISGVGEAVKVSVRDATPVSPGEITPGVLYGVTITVAPGTRGSQINPPYWAPPLSVAVTLGPGTNSGPIQIPVGIGANSLNIAFVELAPGGGVVNPPQMTVGFQRPGGFGLGAFTPLSPDQWVPIPPLARSFQVNNLSATDNITFTYFLGIDG